MSSPLRPPGVHLLSSALGLALLLPSAPARAVPEAAVRALEAELVNHPDWSTPEHEKSWDRYRALAPELVARMEESASEDADRWGKGLRGPEGIAVQLSAGSSAAAEQLEQRVERLGGTVTGRIDAVVFARMTPSQLERLDGAKSLERAALQGIFHPTALTGEGVGVSHSDRLHRLGLTGKGTKVGILDFGFQGYEQLVAKGELPTPTAYRVFSSGRAAEVHGAACAEIVHEMAPDASLYFAEVAGATDEIVRAARWLVAQKVDIISFSGGGHFGPHDGTALLDRLVAEVRQSGVLWVNAAGNEGSSHWRGELRDTNRNQRVDVAGTRGLDALFLELPRGGSFLLYANWDDWKPSASAPAPTNDIDLVLLAYAGGQWRPVGRAAESAVGRGRPMEVVGLRSAPPGTYALIMVGQRISASRTLHIFARGPVRFVDGDPSGSIGIPATSAAALAVGAVHVDDGKLASYSSQGPTDDGRIKPDISGPSNNRSWSYGADGRPGRFTGTSAACPHVSGFAALLHQRFPSAGPDALRAKIIEHARAMGGGRPNSRFGYGHIDGSRVPAPTARPNPPPPRAADRTGEVALDAIEAILDGSGSRTEVPPRRRREEESAEVPPDEGGAVADDLEAILGESP